MRLFAMEHKRLWQRTGTRVCVVLCLGYFVLWGGVLDLQWRVYGSEGEDPALAYGRRFDGYAAIRRYQALADSYGGWWTDETLQKMLEDYRSYDILERPGLQSMADWVMTVLYVNRLYPELEEEEHRFLPMIYYVPTEALTDLYGRRQAYLEDALEQRRQSGELTEKDVAMLLEMNGRVETPWRYRWTSGWDQEAASLANMGPRFAPFLALVLAFTFSGERRGRTAPLLYAAKHGWRKLAWAKVASGLVFTGELYVLVVGGKLAAQRIWFGPGGWDIPIQLNALLAVAPWNMLQAELFAAALLFAGAVGYAGLVMLLSALARSSALALALSLACVYVPGLVEAYLPPWADHALELIPLAASAGDDIFGCNVFHLFGRGIWSPYLLVAVPAAVGMVCVPLAVRRWSRRQRS